MTDLTKNQRARMDRLIGVNSVMRCFCHQSPKDTHTHGYKEGFTQATLYDNERAKVLLKALELITCSFTERGYEDFPSVENAAKAIKEYKGEQ